MINAVSHLGVQHIDMPLTPQECGPLFKKLAGSTEWSNQIWLSRVEIHDRLLSYTRGIDRLDSDLVLSAFHPGAQLYDYGPDPMSVEDFASYAIPSQKRFVATQRNVSNIRIEIDGDLAV